MRKSLSFVMFCIVHLHDLPTLPLREKNHKAYRIYPNKKRYCYVRFLQNTSWLAAVRILEIRYIVL